MSDARGVKSMRSRASLGWAYDSFSEWEDIFENIAHIMR